jgi:hypothetical protein
MSGSVHGANGSFTNPSFAFNSDQNTGLYRIGANNLGVAIGGAKVLDVASTGLTVTGALASTGDVSISSTTAGASNAGALVIAGGISAGNSNVASYFGGSVTVKSDNTKLQVEGSTASNSTQLLIKNPTTDFFVALDSSTGGSFGKPNAGVIWLTSANKLVFATNNSQRMEISSAGDITATGAATFAGDLSAQRLEAVDAAANNRAAAFIRTQNNTTYSSSILSIQGDRTTSNSSYNLIAAANGDSTGQLAVRDSGNVVNTNNSYGAISDRKLKENIVDATAKLQKLNQVRVVNFNRIGNEQKQIGVIAQELEQIFPSMIEVAIDRDAEGNDLGTTTKSVKYSVFVPMLIKAVQELTARLAALESK